MNAELSLPPGLLASLEASAAPRVLLIRHADRPPIPEGDSGVHTPLTSLGEARSRALGQHLGAPLWAVTSPLLRCMRTAALAGAAPETSNLLGDPGPFVIDMVRGGEVFGGHGTRAVVHAQLRGETWGCMRPMGEGAALIHALLRSQLRARQGTGIAVSHDAIVMPYICWATGHTFDEEWLDPLDGLVLTADAVVWRGRRYPVPA